MRKVLSLLCLLATAVLFSGCCISHSWVDASCTEAKHCVKCGEIEGAPLGHHWASATCTKPKTCTVCGVTQGEALGHTWVERSMKAPKTCSVCGETEGEPIYCYEITIPSVRAKAMDNLYFLSEAIITVDPAEAKIHFYNYAETEITTIDVARTGDGSDGNAGENFPNDGEPEGTVDGRLTKTDRLWDYSIIIPECIHGELSVVTTYMEDPGTCAIRLYDHYGELKADLKAKVDLPEGEWLVAYNMSEDRYLRFFSSSYGGTDELPLVTVDCKELQIVESSKDHTVQVYNGSRYFGAVTIPCIDYKYTLVYTRDGQMGYINSRYNYEEKMYKVATCFNIAGLALVSEDGKSFDLINSDLEVIAEDVVQGSNAIWMGDSVFYVYKDGFGRFWSIK